MAIAQILGKYLEIRGKAGDKHKIKRTLPDHLICDRGLAAARIFDYGLLHPFCPSPPAPIIAEYSIAAFKIPVRSLPSLPDGGSAESAHFSQTFHRLFGLPKVRAAFWAALCVAIKR